MRKHPRNRNSSPRRRLRPPGLSLLLLAALAVPVLAVTPQGRLWLDGIERGLDRVEKRLRLRLGMPLRGTPDLARLDQRLREKGLRLGAPVFVRIFKRESVLELWMRKGDRFVLFATYPVCRWSGRLGPKLREGDRQSPEGFYTVSRRQLNPNSRWHRSFNLGFPNLLDRTHGRTGSFLMVHGGCGSIGCYAMTNPVIDEIWRLVTAALRNGQPRFHVHVYPFRMTRTNMALYGDGRWNAFWRDLKRGHDRFEASHVPPRVSVCEGRYVVAGAPPGDDGAEAIRQDCAVRVSGK